MVVSHPVGSGGHAESSLDPLQEQHLLLIPELSLFSPDVALLSVIFVSDCWGLVWFS